jgi:hypothetical protein
VINSDGYNQFWDNMQNKIPFEGIMKRLNKLNKSFIVKGHCHPIFDEDGKPIKVVEVSVDISEFVAKKYVDK